MPQDEDKKQMTEDDGFSRHNERGLLREFAGFLWQNKLWWLVPVLLVLGVLLALMLFAAYSGAAAPFIYPLF